MTNPALPLPAHADSPGYQALGGTGLRISRIGLGGGGPSCLGLKSGKTEAESVGVVRRALELGINLIDTSPRNGSEHLIGHAIRGFDRDALVLSTKASVSTGEDATTPARFAKSLDDSLRALQTDYVDIAHFHGVLPEEYNFMVAELLPVMEKAREAGKVRHVGITEHFNRDREHTMLQRALEDGHFDVMMVGFNMVNQSARDRVILTAREKDIGILGMFAVRQALRSPESFRQALFELQSRNALSQDCQVDQLIKHLSEESVSLTNIAYRYCRDEQGMHSVLVGTGDIDHLEQNVAAFREPPLPEPIRRLIDTTFGEITDFSGNQSITTSSTRHSWN